MLVSTNTFTANGVPRCARGVWWVASKKGKGKYLFIYQTHDVELARKISPGDYLNVLAVEVSRKEYSRIIIVRRHILRTLAYYPAPGETKQHEHKKELFDLNFNIRMPIDDLACRLNVKQNTIKRALDGKTKKFGRKETSKLLKELHQSFEVYEYEELI